MSRSLRAGSFEPRPGGVEATRCHAATIWTIAPAPSSRQAPESEQLGIGGMMTNFVGKTVLITGAASGIGRLMALGAARRGATLVLWDINEERLELVATEIENEGGRAHTHMCDVGDRSAVELVADRVHRDGLRVDVLVNNAGVVAGRYFLDLTEEDIELTFRVNALAHYWTTRAFLPGMVERDSGHIVTIASVAGLFGTPRTTAYSGSKHAVVGFHESLRLEFRRVA